MKQSIRSFAVVAFLALVFTATSGLPRAEARKANSKVFTGEIWDNACATAADHASMAGVMGADPRNHKECTLKCVESGAKFVLLPDSGKNAVYELDDQKAPEEFAGQKVKITGTLKGSTLHVEKIEAAK